MKWLITGASGYVGKHLSGALRSSGEEVFATDVKSSALLNQLVGQENFMKVDIADHSKMKQLLVEKKFEGIIHLAALKSVNESMQHPDRYHTINYEGTKNLAKLASELHIKHFIFASSAAVYGNLESSVYSEECIPNPISPYGLSKFRAEESLLEIAQNSNLNVNIFRYFNIGGSRSRELQDTGTENLIPIIKNKISNKETIQIFGKSFTTKDGTPSRDYVHVEDVVQANLKIIKSYRQGSSSSSVMNIASGQSVTVKEVVDYLFEYSGQMTEIEYVSPRPGDVGTVIGSIKRAESEIGFYPSYTIKDIVTSSL